jgi:hypothetical protein
MATRMGTKQTSTSESGDAPRQRNRQQTALELRAALGRLQATGASPSIAAVAREAGVSAALLHNKYPDFAQEVRRLAGKPPRRHPDDLLTVLELERRRIKELRIEIEGWRQQVRALASVNEALRRELQIQQAMASGNVVTLRRTPEY